jgi:hypothetical protein
VTKRPNEEVPNPRVPETYLPPGGVRYPVSTGETWITIAATTGLSPWDLIDFNFPGTKRALQTNRERGMRQVNWYLREYIGCRTSLDGENWAFDSGLTQGRGSWRGGVIYVPPAFFQQFKRSVAAMSWLDQRPPEKMARNQLLAKRGYVCVNFLEASISTMQTNQGLKGYADGDGFTAASGVYEGSPDMTTYRLYPVKRSRETLDDGIKFTQTVGVIDQSATEDLFHHVPPTSWGGVAIQVFRSLRASETAHVTPPIWTQLSLTMYFNGTFDAEVTSFSLFPNVTLYHSSAFMPSFSQDGGKTWTHNVPLPQRDGSEDYFKQDVSETGMRNFHRWQVDGWGAWGTHGAGNPWGARPDQPGGIARRDQASPRVIQSW